MNQPFTHLRAHSEFSIVESTYRIDQMIAKAKADGQPAVAITDLDGFFGAIRFYEEARSSGIKPIIGVDIQVALTPPPAPMDAEGNPIAPNPLEQPARRLVMIAKDYQGYLKIMRLITRGYTYNMVDNKPVIKEEWLRQENPLGIYCLSGTEKGHIGAPMLLGESILATENAERLKNIFGENLFIEVQRRGAPTDEAFVAGSVAIANELNIPLLATHPIQFANKEDFVAHELKVCDARKEIMPDRNRERMFTPHQHFLSTAEMTELFRDLPDAVANAGALAQSCSLAIPIGKPELPDFQTGTDESLDQFFTRVSHEGLDKRMAKLYPNEATRIAKMPEYTQRLEHEISLIKKMGFEGYFMIVYDFINWAHEHEIPVGPGRGSGAGSLVAYSLGITDLDPLHYNLLFERFLNPDRVSMPDFDIDFCVERRELVIDYVTRKYGSDAVAGITAIGKLASRAAINAAGRALGMNHMMVAGVSKLIPNKPGQEVDIRRAIDEVEEVQARYESEPEVKKLLDHALTLEGLPKSVGRHAAGVVIARGRIADYSPIYVPSAIQRTEGEEETPATAAGNTKMTTQYDKDDLEKVGLVKFDFLGLKNLTMIDKAIRIIKSQPGNENFDLSTIPLDTPEVYEMFRRLDTKAVFQFESDFMKKVISEGQPEKLEDLIALNALGRPGPMDLIPEYKRNKENPAGIRYLDKRMKSILDDTYGIMVYQEQVMQIAQTIGGYSLGGADLLRRAMGKKKVEEMATHRQIFAQGAQKNGLSTEDANKIFSDMEKFAGYGFNKSHAAAYSVIAYQTAYLKVKHPDAFFAAVLSVDAIEDIDEVPKLKKDAESKGIEILPPDINSSASTFVIDPSNPKAIRYSLSGLKGIGIEAVQQILNARNIHGAFESLEDFVEKCSKCVPQRGVNLVNKTVAERLIMAGCFDALHPNRAEAIAAFPLIVKYRADVAKRNAKLENRKTDNALDDLFALSGVDPNAKKKTKPKAPPKPIVEIEKYEWPTLPKQTLMEMLENEKKAFGFYFSDHPMSYFRTQLGDLKAAESISELTDSFPSYDDLHVVAGVVSDIKAFDTKNGKMVKGNISDGDESVEFVAFADAYAPVKDWLKKDAFALFTFQVKEDKFKGGGNSYTAQNIRNFSEAQTYLAHTVHVAIEPDLLPKLKSIAEKNPGSTPITLWHPVNGKHAPSKDPVMNIDLTPALLDQLKQEFGKYVKIDFPKTKKIVKAPPKPKGKQWRN